jgi:CSLREA domain-containing protein
MVYQLVILGLVFALANQANLAGASGVVTARPNRPAVTITVDSTDDGGDSNTADSICYNSVVGACTLRAAIQQAGTLGGSPTIVFHSSIDHTTITLQAGLGPILWNGSNITLDGNASDMTIDASSLGLTSGQGVFEIGGDNNIISGLTISGSAWDGIQVGDFSGTGSGNNNTIRYNTLLNNAAAGVYVRGGSGGGGQGNQVLNNYIGARADATVCPTTNRNAYGIYVALGAVDTHIGNNAIFCNARDGVSINGSGGAPHSISLTVNDIGGNDSDMGNGWAGVAVYSGAYSVTLDNNVIVGNDRQGVWLGNTNNVNIINNHIGVSTAGAKIPNAYQGIHVDGTQGVVSNVLINNNIIAWNLLQGVLIEDSNHVDVFNGQVVYNGAAGVAVVGNGSVSNRVYPSKDFGNGGLAIDLGNDGFTSNGSHTPPGPDDWLPYPVITQSSGNIITGTACASCNVYVYHATMNTTKPGGGYTYYMGGTSADGAGHWHFALGDGATRFDVTLQACSVAFCGINSQVSELSPRVQVYLPIARKP